MALGMASLSRASIKGVTLVGHRSSSWLCLNSLDLLEALELFW